MTHKSKSARNQYNNNYQRNRADRDYFEHLREMGEPQRIIQLLSNNGHVCEEIPLCRKPAAYVLVFRTDTVTLCAGAYKRYNEHLDPSRGEITSGG